ncbi:MAG: C39 family peptidase [Bacilli bacterium]|nr:C39 family peptidase [Bacilli bacterium]
MDKDIKPYRQRGATCAVACMLMVLEYYKIISKANWYDERRFYRIYGSKNMDGTPFSALAYHFSKNGLNTSLYHSEESLFHNKNNAFRNKEFEYLMAEYKEHLEHAIKSGTNVVNGIDIKAKLLKQKLEEGNIIILAGQIGEIYHAILLSGYEDDKFIVCDPLYRQKQIKTFAEIEQFMNTNIGKWFVTVNNY